MNRATRLVPLAVLVAGLSSSPMVAAHHYTCPVSPVEDRLPSVIAPLAGHDPFWVVAGMQSPWTGEHHPVKTAWVLSRRNTEDVRIRGHRLDGAGTMTFRVGDGARTDELTVTDIGTQGVTPGGASQEIMRQYAFLVAYTFVPSRGCWEMRATVGEREHKVVVEVQ